MIEHLSDPRLFFEHAGRVSQRGLFTSPSALAERLISFPNHKWLIEQRKQDLYFRAKSGPICDPAVWEFFNAAVLGSPARYDQFMLDHLKWMEVRYYWEGAPRCVVEGAPSAEGFIWADADPGDKAIKHVLTGTEGLRNNIKTVIRRLAHAIVSAHRDVSLASILACPNCFGDVEMYPERVHCPACALDYPMRGGVPVMLVECAVHTRGAGCISGSPNALHSHSAEA